MKLHYLAAATLLLGTSALAWQPEPQTAEIAATIVEAKDGAAESSWGMKEAADDVQAEPAAVAWDEPNPDPNLDLAAKPDDVHHEAADTGDSGMGGPIETAAADLAPRPAAGNYPPCAPGPGDDNCIQLYEPGVEVALASWNAPTGGLSQPGEAMASAETALEPDTGVGGPYEPVDVAMNGDGLIEPDLGETADFETDI